MFFNILGVLNKIRIFIVVSFSKNVAQVARQVIIAIAAIFPLNSISLSTPTNPIFISFSATIEEKLAVEISASQLSQEISQGNKKLQKPSTKRRSQVKISLSTFRGVCYFNHVGK